MLKQLAATYQERRIVARCGGCAKPCCRLETLVLELDWKRLRGLWDIQSSRLEYDAALARGQGLPEIRSRDGLYYAYGRRCPAYDEGGRRCRVYDTALKPSGCKDFPVYEEDGHLVADLRCEAVALDELCDFLRQELGEGARVTVNRNPEFPFLVSIDVDLPAEGDGF